MARLRGLAPFMVYILALSIVFRSWIFSGFDLGFGDRADGIIEISLLEHWRNVFAGAETWNQPIYFWPHVDTLGYNDGYLLFGVDYAVWRLIADPFHADMLNIVVFRSIAFWASWALARRTLDFGREWSLLIASIFTISGAMIQQAVHAQLQSVALLPVAAMLAITAVRHELLGDVRRARTAGVLLALLMAVWLLTSYYMAWFTLYFGLVFGVVWLCVSGTWRPRRFSLSIRAHGVTAGITSAAFIIFSIPFIAVYWPKLSESGGHGLGEAKPYLTWFYDVANMGEGNYVWGWTLRPLHVLFEWFGGPVSADGHLGGEHVSGFPLLLFVLVDVGDLVRERSRPPVMRAFALTIAISWLLMLQAGPLSPWALVHWLVPGASGIRVVLRYQLFLLLPALLLFALTFADRARRMAARRPVSMAVLVTLLVAEQLVPVTSAALARSAQTDLMRDAPPPTECHSFYVVDARTTKSLYRDADMQAIYPHNVDAMLLAMLWRVPTLNGYATFLPPGWVFAGPAAIDYDRRATAYIAANHLQGVCRFDASSPRPWRRVT